MALNKTLLPLSLFLVLASSAAAQNCRDGGVLSIVTDAFFNGIVENTASTCAGKNFYTHSAFLSAFRAVGSSDDQKREITAFFANVAHEIGCKFGATIRAINSMECNGGNADEMNDLLVPT